MEDVPSDLLWEILVRFPAEYLLRIKTVCKEWVRIIEDPFFIKAHANNQYLSHTLLVNSPPGLPLYSLSLDAFNFIINGSRMIDVTRINNVIPPSSATFHSATCNGLILASTEDYTDISVILNPLTRECHYFRKPSNVNFSLYRYIAGYGFGYHSDSDDYKVVRIYDSYRTLIYSLKSDSWRTVEDSPCTCMKKNAAFLNGSFYWLSWDTDAIIALDLGTERYCQLPQPPVTSGFPFDLAAMDGCLICSLKDNDKETFDGWVMKDDGVDKSWIKLFSFQISLLRLGLGLRVAAYLKRKNQLVLRHQDGFFCFDIDSNSFKKCSVYGLDFSSCLLCPGSLVRLSDYRGSHIGFGDVTTKKTLPAPEKMKIKIICDDL